MAGPFGSVPSPAYLIREMLSRFVSCDDRICASRISEYVFSYNTRHEFFNAYSEPRWAESGRPGSVTESAIRLLMARRGSSLYKPERSLMAGKAAFSGVITCIT